MGDLKLYSVTDRYITYLRKTVPGVYSNKEGNRTHTRKYLGVVFSIDDYRYFIPLSSPKESDYELKNGERKIRKSNIPIIRIVDKNAAGEDELKGTLRISHMIPVPASELHMYDLEHEQDSVYKDLVQKEVIFIRKHKEKIMKNAQVLYKQKANNDTTAKYVKTALDFKSLESLCDQFEA